MILALAGSVPHRVALAATFEEYFAGGTLRLEYLHFVGDEKERIAVAGLRGEGPWPGSRNQLVDDPALGDYRFEISNLVEQSPIYTRSFGTLHGDLSGPLPAHEPYRVTRESLRFPEPLHPFEIRLYRRMPDGELRQIFRTAFDPRSRFVDRSPITPQQVWTIQENGSPRTKVDLLFLFRLEPLASHRDDFNIRAIDLVAPNPAAEGNANPGSPLGTVYDRAGGERWALRFADSKWREIAAAAPYDFAIILVNGAKAVGGGVHQRYAAVNAGSAHGTALLAHEFGHLFAALGDEYFDPRSGVDGATPVAEPWEPNVTALHDPDALKWKDLVEPETPIPTRCDVDRFATQWSAEKTEASDPVGGRIPRTGAVDADGARVGAFEGAAHRAHGLFRPTADCLMFSLGSEGYCPVCQRAMRRTIRLYAR
jgi:hypothetical protein